MAGNEQVSKDEFSKEYSEETFAKKIASVAKDAGINVIYVALILYYTLKKPTTPKWVKAKIIAALGYFISPLDAIPDFTPVVGYADDIGVLLLALAVTAIYVNKEIKMEAKNKLEEWFGDYDASVLDDIDNRINTNMHK